MIGDAAVAATAATAAGAAAGAAAAAAALCEAVFSKSGLLSTAAAAALHKGASDITLKKQTLELSSILILSAKPFAYSTDANKFVEFTV